MKTCVVLLAVMLGVGCSGSEDTPDAGGTPTSGGSCGRHADCPEGFACRARACINSCTSNQPYVGGCVNGATCEGGTCRKNTSCNESTECAYDKGEVCDFSSGMCVTAQSTCSEGEMQTVCDNGYLCHIYVCYEDCSGAKGCPSGKTCVNNACE